MAHKQLRKDLKPRAPPKWREGAKTPTASGILPEQFQNTKGVPK